MLASKDDKHHGSLWREPPSSEGSSLASGSLPSRARPSEACVVTGVRSGATLTGGGGRTEGRKGWRSIARRAHRAAAREKARVRPS